MKQIVFTKKDTAELLEVAKAPLGSTQVRVKTAISSISCGTERANIMGDEATNISGVYEPFPRTSGYSSAGTVVEVGDAVTSVKVGDRVCMSWSKHIEYNVCDENFVVKLDDGIDFNDAALFHIGTFPIAAIRKVELEIGESLMVMGLGILGLFAVTFAKAAGAVPVIAVDPVAKRREKALQFGADYAFDPFDKDFVEKVKEVTDGGVNTAIEVTGVGAGLDECLDCMARFGRVSLLGCTRSSDFSIDYYKKVHGPGIKLIGAHTLARPMSESSHAYFTQRDDIKSIMKLVGANRFSLKAMVDEVYSPNDCGDVYTRLVNDKNFPVVSQFDWSRL